MNKQTYTIERAYDIARNGLDKQVGWDIYAHEQGMSNPNWCNRYALLRDAKAALALEGIKATIVH